MAARALPTDGSELLDGDQSESEATHFLENGRLIQTTCRLIHSFSPVVES
jgi:hypothetical protein